MKNHRKTGALRLSALVLFLVACLPLAGFAQEIPSAAFPFLSIDTAQMNSLRTAFMFQWGLFNGYNGNGPTALYYVALAAALVGALAIVFNNALHSTKVIASWLLICVVCLFAPYNSKLLFYPLEQPRDGIVTGKVIEGTKGFTPQLVAAHVGTTLQVIFTDLFNSAGFKGLVDGIEAQTQLGTMPESCPNPAWLPQAQAYKTCGPILPTALQSDASGQGNSGGAEGSNTAVSDAGSAAFTLPNFLRSLEEYYMQDPKADKAFTTAPPLFALFSDYNSIPESNRSDYVQGLQVLWNTLYGTSQDENIKCVKEINANCETTYRDLFNKLQDHATSARDSQSVDSLGYYMETAEGASASTGIIFRSNVADDIAKQIRTGSQCTGTAAQQRGCNQNRAGGATKTKNYDIARRQFSTQLPTKAGDGGIAYNDKLSRLKQAMGESTPEAEALKGLPIHQINAANGHVAVTSNACDSAQGDHLFQQLFASSGNVPAGLKKYFTGNVAMPAAGQWTVNDIRGTSNVATPTANEKLYLAQLNHPGFQEQWNKLQNSNEQQRLLAKTLVDNAEGSCNLMARSQQNEQMFGALNQTQPTQVGGGMAGRVASAIVEYLGKFAVIIGSFFAGIFAGAVINIMKTIVDLMMMMVILITPIAFLFGIALPNHAAGLLIQSVLAIGILKLVPVTFVVVDRMGDVIYRSISAANTGWVDTSFKQGIFLFGIATIYTGLVGMTMFLLFKIGDPGNIQKLTELDKAADQVADAGKKMAAAIGAFVGVGVAGAAFGAAGWLGAAKGGAGAAAGLKAVGTGMANAAMGTMTGGLVPGMPGDPNAPRDPSAMKGAAVEERALPLSGDDKLRATFGLEARGPGGDPTDPLFARMGENYTPPEGANAITSSSGPANPDDPLFARMGQNYVPTDDDGLYQQALADNAAVDAKTVSDNMVRAQDANRAAYRGEAQRVFSSVTGKNANMDIDADAKAIDAIAEDLRFGKSVSEVQAKYRSLGTFGTVGGVVAQGVPGGMVAAQGTSVGSSGNTTASSAAITATTATTSAATTATSAAAAAPQSLAAWANEFEAKLNSVLQKGGDTLGQSIQSGLAKGADKLTSTQLAQANRAVIDEAQIQAKIKPEVAPGFWSTVYSGFRGGIMAHGGWADIPVVGKILAETVNEYYEAPERARKWANNEGGSKGWFKAKADAQRMKAADKMGADYGAAEQYRATAETGSFNAGVRAAQQSARQSVAKATDEYRALLAKEAQLGRSLNVNDYVGGNMVQAIESLEKTLNNAAFMRSGKVAVGPEGASKDFKFKDIARQVIASQAAKDTVDSVTDMMAKHMYNSTKHDRTGYRGMIEGKTAETNKYIYNEIGLDYQPDATVKWLEGKEGFRRRQGMMRGIQEAIAKQEVMLSEYKKQNPRAGKAQLDALKKILPVERVHEMALANGYGNMRVKFEHAKYIENEKEDIEERLAGFANAGKAVERFNRDLGLISSNIAALARSLGISEAALANLPDVLTGLGRNSKISLGRGGAPDSKIQEEMEVLREAITKSGETVNEETITNYYYKRKR